MVTGVHWHSLPPFNVSSMVSVAAVAAHAMYNAYGTCNMAHDWGHVNLADKLVAGVCHVLHTTASGWGCEPSGDNHSLLAAPCCVTACQAVKSIHSAGAPFARLVLSGDQQRPFSSFKRLL